jgi:energy-coupling factor transporter ATP-binding protein EcfA2
MLTRLAITDFQSHSNTSLELGPFTVVVGPSSSGKSAIARALRLLVSNASGTAYVRHGARKTRVSAAFAMFAGDPIDAQLHVAIERGPSLSRFELTIPDQDVIEFTKCGKTVPEMILDAHDLSQDELWVAGQFDRPFLLDETGSAIARTLGDLTNVSMIFAAVRECNRRASGAKAKHTDRKSTLDQVRTRLLSYSDLPVKVSACDAAEQALERASDFSQRRALLQALVLDAENSYSRLLNARAELRAVPDASSLLRAESRRSRLAEALRTVEDAVARRAAIRQVNPPEVGALLALSERRTMLRTLLTEVVKSELSRRQAVERAATAGAAAEEARDRLSGALTQAGMCPVCGAAPEHARLDRITGISR